MKYKIVENTARKTLTVVITPIVIAFTEYLFKRYKDERFFATGTLQGAGYKEEIVPLAKEIAAKLNEISKESLPKGVQFELKDILSLDESEYKLISKNLDQEKKWDNQFKVSLTNKSKDDNKRFLFNDLEETSPIAKDDSWKHTYAIEIEIGAGYNEDTMEKYVYTIFHRAISSGLRPDINTSMKNDNAWAGFNFKSEKEEAKKSEELPWE